MFGCVKVAASVSTLAAVRLIQSEVHMLLRSSSHWVNSAFYRSWDGEMSIFSYLTVPASVSASTVAASSSRWGQLSLLPSAGW